MAEKDSSRRAQAPLVDRVLQCGKSAFDPSVAEESRISKEDDFNNLIASTSTLSLLPVLNLLVQPERVHSWLRTPILSALVRLPLRPRGVQHTIEFILSVHPTTSGANSEQRTGRGSAISHEALNAASRLLSSPPAGMDPEEWFRGIAPQLFSLLQGEGEPEMDKAAAFVIGFGILGRRQYGAPGMPGWKAFVEPIFRCIDPSLVLETQLDGLPSSDEDPIITLGSSRILTSSHDLATAIQRLSILLSSHPNPALTKRLLKPLLLPLWALGNWPVGDGKTESRYRLHCRNLLKSLIQLTTNVAASKESTASSVDIIPVVLNNLRFKGRLNPGKISWTYGIDWEGGGIQVQAVPDSQSNSSAVHEFERIDGCVLSFVALLGSIPDLAPEISRLFLELFRKWISSSKSEQPSILTRPSPANELETFQKKFIEVKVMQSLIDTFPDKLVENSSQVLEVASEVLSDFTKSDASNEDTTAVALSLLNIVLTSPSFRPTHQTEEILTSIQSSLKAICCSTSEVSTTAKNLLLLLRFRSMVEEPDIVQSTSATDQQQEDRKSYNLAISYLTTIDSPPPVRAQGLELISGLIKTSSSILDIPSLLVLLSSLLQDDEEYIYLRAVKTFIQLSEKHPKTVLKDLIERYVDSQEEAELDQRLRIGEALLQVIQNRYLAFTGEISKLICEGLLFIAGRRGYRQKAEQAQERKKNLKRKQNREAEEAWDGEVPQLDEVLEMEAREEEEFAARVVGGWESKRGTEDIRIRSSALAIIGSAIEANVAGIASSILSMTIDLCIHILTLEPEEEKGILRRSAILAFMSFVRALDVARQEGRKLGFGFVGQSLEDVQRILGYVEGSDNDGLVRQHAKDVVESLQAWQMNMLSSSVRDQTGGIQELAGLSVNPNAVQDSEGRMRPRIEEVE